MWNRCSVHLNMYQTGINSLDASHSWVEALTIWHNAKYKHNRLNYVPPSGRHCGKYITVLRQRAKVLMEHRQKKPECGQERS